VDRYHAPAAAHNSIPQTEQHLRAGLNALQARYDGVAVPPAVYAIIRTIGTELSWLEHRGRP
jgi:hypothetical protein